MTLSMSMPFKGGIIALTDLRESTASKYYDKTIKTWPLWKEWQHVALLAGDVGVATAILQRLMLEAKRTGKPDNGDMEAMGARLGEMAREHYDAAFGGDWSMAPPVAFLITGFDYAEGSSKGIPRTLYMYNDDRFVLRAANYLPITLGVTDVADAYLAKLFDMSADEKYSKRLSMLVMIASGLVTQTISQDVSMYVLGDRATAKEVNEAELNELKNWAQVTLGLSQKSMLDRLRDSS